MLPRLPCEVLASVCKMRASAWVAMAKSHRFEAPLVTALARFSWCRVKKVLRTDTVSFCTPEMAL